eukprot:gene12170-2783_t
MNPVSKMFVCCFLTYIVVGSMEESPVYEDNIIDYILRDIPRDNEQGFGILGKQGHIDSHQSFKTMQPESNIDQIETKSLVSKRDRRLQCIVRDAWGRCRRYRKLGLWGKRDA